MVPERGLRPKSAERLRGEGRVSLSLSSFQISLVSSEIVILRRLGGLRVEGLALGLCDCLVLNEGLLSDR